MTKMVNEEGVLCCSYCHEEVGWDYESECFYCPNCDPEEDGDAMEEPEAEEPQSKQQKAIEELAKRLYLGRMAMGLNPNFGDCMEEAEFSYLIDIADMLAEGDEDEV